MKNPENMPKPKSPLHQFSSSRILYKNMSSEHLFTVDEDSIRQQLTKIYLQFSNGWEEYRQPADNTSSYVMSSASISEIGSAYTINSITYQTALCIQFIAHCHISTSILQKGIDGKADIVGGR